MVGRIVKDRRFQRKLSVGPMTRDDAGSPEPNIYARRLSLLSALHQALCLSLALTWPSASGYVALVEGRAGNASPICRARLTSSVCR